MGPASENPSTRLKVPHTISQVAKFKCNLLKTSEDIATQTRRVLQRFVWWGGGGGGRFVPPPPPPPWSGPPPYKRLENFATLWTNIFACFGGITLKFGNSTNI